MTFTIRITADPGEPLHFCLMRAIEELILVNRRHAEVIHNDRLFTIDLNKIVSDISDGGLFLAKP